VSTDPEPDGGHLARRMTSIPSLLIFCRAVHFEIHYNADRIIEINVSTDPSQTVDISPDVASKTEGQQTPAEFTYSITWRETVVPFEKRMDKYRCGKP